MNRRRFLKLSAAAVGSGLLARSRAVAGSLPSEAEAFLDDLQRRAFRFFWEQTDSETGIVRGAAHADGSYFLPRDKQNGSNMVTGFGLAALCIAAERGWVDRKLARDRAARTLATCANHTPDVRGWSYHWVNLLNGRRDGPIGVHAGGSEISSVDQAFLLAGALTVREYFRGDAEISRLANSLYARVDFPWMLAPGTLQLSHGWMPGRGFFHSNWSQYSEATLLYLLAIASPTHPIPPQAWYAWQRNRTDYGPFHFVGDQPLFTYQYSHAFVDYRGRREADGRGIDWFANSVTGTRAHRQFCLDLAGEFHDYSPDLWGITTSASDRGYVSWGGPPREGPIDGTVVPCAPGGSLMFAPDICLPALLRMRERFGDRIYHRYGFADAFNPLTGWVSKIVQGLDVGITLLAAENLRTGNLWRWFMLAPEIQRALALARIVPATAAGPTAPAGDTP